MTNKKMTRQAKKAAGINKSVHIEVHNSIHKKLRALLFLKEMSLQGFFRLMAESFVNGDDYIEKLVDQRVDDIQNKRLDQLRNVNKRELYNAIEENSPFKKED
jgi:hypothetical protein